MSAAGGLQNRRFRLGLIVNPLAGIGGSVALKGSDGAAIVEEALSRGAEMRAIARAARALSLVQPLEKRIELYTCGGAMGEEAGRIAGFAAMRLVQQAVPRSSGTHTITAARLMAEVPVDLLLFAGGDGTARDICTAIGTRLPALGVPAGVKMHSGAYAVSPEAAGEIVTGLVTGQLTEVAEAEVRDLDEEAFRAGRVVARHYGDLLVPVESRYVQRVKSAADSAEENIVEDIAADVVEGMQAGVLYILGPGSTTMAIKQLLGIRGTLLGVDAVRDGLLLSRDASEADLLALLSQRVGDARIIVTAIGGQGHVFGRGNQQISAAVIRAVGIENIRVVATRGKIRALEGRPLLVDTNDPVLDKELHRFVQVITGYHEAILYPVA